jgi:surface protein
MFKSLLGSGARSRHGLMLLVLITGAVVGGLLVPSGRGVPAEAAPTFSGDPMILKFDVTAVGQQPYVRFGTSDELETVKVKIDWGRTGEAGNIQTYTSPGSSAGITDGNAIVAPPNTLAYPVGEYTVTISPLLVSDDPSDGTDVGPWLTIYGRTSPGGFTLSLFDSRAHLVEVVSFGDLGLRNLSQAFADHQHLTQLPSSLPSSVTNAQEMFWSSAFNASGITGWDVSNVTNMNSLFRNAGAFNQPIGVWDVSSVTYMNSMFRDAGAFNQPIGEWDVSSVTDVRNMFQNAGAFNQPIGAWTVSSVTDMTEVFRNARAFNQPIGGWDVSNVTNMSRMFQDARAFDQPLGGWDVSNVTTMRAMFRDAQAFDQPIGGWDVSNVTNMAEVFRNAQAFDQPIGGWDVSNVTNMNSMFSGAEAFDQPLGGWDVSNVTNMNSMFQDAAAFNRSLGYWTLNSGVALDGFLNRTGLSTACYDATLIGWAGLDPAVENRDLGAEGLTYSQEGSVARAVLVDDRGWQIDDSGLAGDVASEPCVEDVIAPETTAAPGPVPVLSCDPPVAVAGVTVTCTAVFADPGFEFLWAASEGVSPRGGVVRMDTSGVGTFQFTVTSAVPAAGVSIELVDWGVATRVGLGGPVPSSVPAGGGTRVPVGFSLALLWMLVTVAVVRRRGVVTG